MSSTRTPGKWRLLGAFALLPLVDAAVAFVALPPAIAMLAGIMGLFVTLSGAMPVVYWLIRRGPVTFAQILIAGLALGNVPFAIYALAMIPYALLHLALGTLKDHLIPVSALLAGALFSIAIGTGMGMISAAVFWFAAFRGTDVTR